MELVKSYKKVVLTSYSLPIKILFKVPSICLGRYMDKINQSLLAYVLLLRCLFVRKINVACNLQLVSTLLMTGSIKCLALKYGN